MDNKIICEFCKGNEVKKNGISPSGKQKFYCKTCNKFGTLNSKPNGYTTWSKKEICLYEREIISDTYVVEADEMWPYVQNKKNKQWIWLAMCRKIRQIISYAVWERNADPCKLLYQNIPQSYKNVLYILMIMNHINLWYLRANI